MTVVVYVLAGIGATTLLAAVALTGAGWRTCRDVDAQAPPEPADYAAIRARLDADVNRIIERRPAVYDWECEGDCPDCQPPLLPPALWDRAKVDPPLDPPLDPRDVALWGRQILSADEDQIMREATR